MATNYHQRVKELKENFNDCC